MIQYMLDTDTNNEREFGGVSNLKIDNWAK
jgi:hypothetical protein